MGKFKSNAWEIDAHYKDFFEDLQSKTCTFCGINQLPNPESYRADYDHIAYKGLYPISTINLKNIAHPALNVILNLNCKKIFSMKMIILQGEFLIIPI